MKNVMPAGDRVLLPAITSAFNSGGGRRNLFVWSSRKKLELEGKSGNRQQSCSKKEI